MILLFPKAQLSVNLSVSQSASLSVSRSVSLSVSKSVSQSVCLSVCLSVCQSVCLSVCLPVFNSLETVKQIFMKQMKEKTVIAFNRLFSLLDNVPIFISSHTKRWGYVILSENLWAHLYLHMEWSFSKCLTVLILLS